MSSNTKGSRKAPASKPQFWIENCQTLLTRKDNWNITESYRERIQNLKDQAEYEEKLHGKVNNIIRN